MASDPQAATLSPEQEAEARRLCADPVLAPAPWEARCEQEDVEYSHSLRGPDGDEGGWTRADAEFIAAARTLLPAALASLDAARRERDEVLSEAVEWRGLCQDAARERDVYREGYLRVQGEMGAERLDRINCHRVLWEERDAAIARAEKAEYALNLTGQPTAAARIRQAEAERDAAKAANAWSRAEAEDVARLEATAERYAALRARHKRMRKAVREQTVGLCRLAVRVTFLRSELEAAVAARKKAEEERDRSVGALDHLAGWTRACRERDDALARVAELERMSDAAMARVLELERERDAATSGWDRMWERLARARAALPGDQPCHEHGPYMGGPKNECAQCLKAADAAHHDGCDAQPAPAETETGYLCPCHDALHCTRVEGYVTTRRCSVEHHDECAKEGR